MANNLFSSISSLHTDDEPTIKYEELTDDKSKNILSKGSISQLTPNNQAAALNNSEAENKLQFLQRAYQNPLEAFFFEHEYEEGEFQGVDEEQVGLHPSSTRDKDLATDRGVMSPTTMRQSQFQKQISNDSMYSALKAIGGGSQV